jgi:hypothetical protein
VRALDSYPGTGVLSAVLRADGEIIHHTTISTVNPSPDGPSHGGGFHEAQDKSRLCRPLTPWRAAANAGPERAGTCGSRANHPLKPAPAGMKSPGTLVRDRPEKG